MRKLITTALGLALALAVLGAPAVSAKSEASPPARQVRS
jgi:hypothetical protein